MTNEDMTGWDKQRDQSNIQPLLYAPTLKCFVVKAKEKQKTNKHILITVKGHQGYLLNLV